MPVAIAASVLGLIVVLVAFYRDEPLEERTREPTHWDLLPDPNDIARTEFPLSFPGYEPATVEFHFDLLARAYADLLAVAPPEVIARARHRAAVRRGVQLPDAEAAPASTAAGATVPATRQAATPPRPAASSLAAAGDEGPDVEALRAEAALADLETHSGEH